MIYSVRVGISAWSHPVFLLARLLRRPGIYVLWARAVLPLYHGVAYSRGRLGVLIDRIRRRPCTGELRTA